MCLPLWVEVRQMVPMFSGTWVWPFGNAAKLSRTVEGSDKRSKLLNAKASPPQKCRALLSI